MIEMMTLPESVNNLWLPGDTERLVSAQHFANAQTVALVWYVNTVAAFAKDRGDLILGFEILFNFHIPR